MHWLKAHHLTQDVRLCSTLLSIYHKLYCGDQCRSATLHQPVNFHFLLMLICTTLLRKIKPKHIHIFQLFSVKYFVKYVRTKLLNNLSLSFTSKSLCGLFVRSTNEQISLMENTVRLLCQIGTSICAGSQYSTQELHFEEPTSDILRRFLSKNHRWALFDDVAPTPILWFSERTQNHGHKHSLRFATI